MGAVGRFCSHCLVCLDAGDRSGSRALAATPINPGIHSGQGPPRERPLCFLPVVQDLYFLIQCLQFADGYKWELKL